MSIVIGALPWDDGGVLLPGQPIGKRSFISENIKLLGRFFRTFDISDSEPAHIYA